MNYYHSNVRQLFDRVAFLVLFRDTKGTPRNPFFILFWLLPLHLLSAERMSASARRIAMANKGRSGIRPGKPKFKTLSHGRNHEKGGRPYNGKHNRHTKRSANK